MKEILHERPAQWPEPLAWYFRKKIKNFPEENSDYTFTLDFEHSSVRVIVRKRKGELNDDESGEAAIETEDGHTEHVINGKLHSLDPERPTIVYKEISEFWKADMFISAEINTEVQQ